MFWFRDPSSFRSREKHRIGVERICDRRLTQPVTFCDELAAESACGHRQADTVAFVLRSARSARTGSLALCSQSSSWPGGGKYVVTGSWTLRWVTCFRAMELSCLKLGEFAVRYRLLLRRADVQTRTLAHAEAHDFAACAALFMRVRDVPDQAQRESSSSATGSLYPE